MARYIDAIALQRRICGARCGCECEDCGNEGDCVFEQFITFAPTADVAPRAEIERLETENKLLIENDVRNKYPNCVSVEKGRIYTRTLEDYDELIGDISAEAIKEFAERAKEKMQNLARMEYGNDEIYFLIGKSFIDNLVKEMTE